MDNHQNDLTYQNVIQLEESASSSRKFLANVFLWMFVALAVSAGIAFYFINNPSLFENFISAGRLNLLGYAAIFSPLVFVIAISRGMNKISFPVLTVLFIAYAAITGISLSFIIFQFTAASVLGVFITTSALFGVMAIAGYTTHQDLTKFGSILIMLLIGVIIATVVNMFLHSDGLSYILNYVAVAIFIGLTAYDVQKLKRIGEGIEYGDASSKKMAIMGALTLYLDFINMFIYLLQIFGRRK
ncbi:BAX inhibitor (BI)-1/YccA family protein [Pedobacter sp. HMF7647]|uniref:BAX inhibitor (BI)-1/YccA family protein n=1 Tax=Hufsiella arboris TaxID=2695275 RepID=A0A7K1Y9E2_9SPHI|nr:Bax inhibitor-1/YccA family protein [Hufsiella arboris]MXV51040.1 BAX inhibitor (BI)-1/YccA family protein [Hufsiella arboris]